MNKRVKQRAITMHTFTAYTNTAVYLTDDGVDDEQSEGPLLLVREQRSN